MANILMRMAEVKDLSPSERHVVEYILEHCQEACRMGIVELGEKTFTSATTVKRLCRKLGVNSYTNFRMQLSAAQSHYARYYLGEARAPVGRYDSVAEVLDKVSRHNASAIMETSQMVDTQMMTQVVEQMAAAGRIEFYGMGNAYIVAQDARDKCLRLKIRCSAWSDRVSMLMSAKNADEKTVAFLVSTSSSAEDMIAVAQELRRHHAVTVALTCDPDDLLGHVCRYDLCVDTGECGGELGGMLGCISMLNLTGALFTALINTDYERYARSLRETDMGGEEAED